MAPKVIILTSGGIRGQVGGHREQLPPATPLAPPMLTRLSTANRSHFSIRVAGIIWPGQGERSTSV